MRLFVLLLACVASETGISGEPAAPASDPDAPAEDTAPPEDTAPVEDTAPPDPYVYDGDEAADALLDADGVAAALEEALSTFLVDMDPFLVLEAFDAAVAYQDEGCPYWYEEYRTLYGYDYLYGGCDTAEGSSYEGYIYGIHYEPFSSYGYYYPDYGWWYGDVTVETADSQAFELTGYWSMYKWEIAAPAQTYVAVSASGEAGWQGGAYGDTWLGYGASLAYTLAGGFDPQLGSYLQLDGGLSGLPGTANSLWMDGVWIGSAGQGSSCPLEPSGTLSLRDDAGDWYDVEFHGPSYAGASAFPPECDGCGDVWYRGAQIGEACVDFSLLTDWVGAPW